MRRNAALSRPSAIAATCALALLLPAGAAAGPPYTTDDPEPVELRHWEVYLASQGTWTRGDVASGTLPHLEVNYGAAPDLQLHLIAPLAWSRAPGQPARFGYGDTELGAKYRFVHESESGWVPQVGTFPLVELPTGDAARGLGAGKAQVLVPLWLQKSFGPWTSYGGAGYWVNPGSGNRNWWFFGWQAQRKVGPAALGAEIWHATAREVGGQGETRVDLGAVVDFGELHHLLASAGTALERPAAQWYLGYQLTFGPGGSAGEHPEHDVRGR